MSKLILVLFLWWCFAKGLNKKTVKFCYIAAFKEIQMLDDDWKVTLKEGLKDVCKVFRQFVRFPKQKVGHHMAGSLNEGAFTARLFMVNKLFDKNINRMLEADFEFQFMTIHDLRGRYEQCITEIHDKPSFVKFNVTNCHYDNKREQFRFHRLNEFKNDAGFLKSYKLKEYFLTRYKNYNIKYTVAIQIILSILLDILPNRIRISTALEQVQKASISTSFTVGLDDRPVGQGSLDLTLLIRLDMTSILVKEWVSRKKKWPPMDSLSAELAVSYVITKSSFQEKLNKDSTELRFSFAHIERKLVSLQTPTQRLVYLIFKSFIYRWIIPIRPNIVSSFVAKTVMLWTCEQIPPTDSFWEDDSNSIRTAVRHLFQRLLEACGDRVLPYYFVPSINVIENYPEEVLVAMTARIRWILRNPKASIPDNLKEVVRFLKNTSVLKTKILNVFEKMKAPYGLELLVLQNYGLAMSAKDIFKLPDDLLQYV